MEIELKPCPFCGEQPKIHPANPERDGGAWTSIECANCVTMPPDTHSVARVTHYADSGHFEAALAAWNTRAPDPELARLRAENEALRERIAELDPDGATGCADDRLPGSTEDWRAALKLHAKG